MSKNVILKRACGEAVLYDGSYESIREIKNLYKKYFDMICYNCSEETDYKNREYLLRSDGKEDDLIIGNWYIFDGCGIRIYPDESTPMFGLPAMPIIHNIFYFVEDDGTVIMDD